MDTANNAFLQSAARNTWAVSGTLSASLRFNNLQVDYVFMTYLFFLLLGG